MIDRQVFMQEMELRKHIREAIKVTRQRRRARLAEEQRLRKTIRSLIMEADPAVATDAVHANTGINALEDLFKNSNMLTTLRQGYKSLTSKKEQRESYKNHILNAVDSSIEVQDSLFDTSEEEGALQERFLPISPLTRHREEGEVSACLLRYADAYAEEAGVPVEQLLARTELRGRDGDFNPDKLGRAGQAGGLGDISKEECDDLIRKYPEQAPAALQKLITQPGALQEVVDIDVGAPEGHPAFIDVEKKETTPEEEVEEFTISGQDKTGRNRAYTDYKDIEKNLITAFDDLDDPSDRQMFKDYLLTNLKLYFERFEEELQTDLPPPDIQTPPDAEVAPPPEAAAPPVPPEGAPGPPVVGLQERLNLDMDEIVGWLLSNDTKK
jgi:hypothetical protein